MAGRPKLFPLVQQINKLVAENTPEPQPDRGMFARSLQALAQDFETDLAEFKESQQEGGSGGVTSTPLQIPELAKLEGGTGAVGGNLGAAASGLFGPTTETVTEAAGESVGGGRPPQNLTQTRKTTSPFRGSPTLAALGLKSRSEVTTEVPNKQFQVSIDRSRTTLATAHDDLRRGRISKEEFGAIRTRALAGLNPQQQASLQRSSLEEASVIRSARADKAFEAGRAGQLVLLEKGVAQSDVPKAMGVLQNFFGAENNEEQLAAGEQLAGVLRNTAKQRTARAEAARKLSLDEQQGITQALDQESAILRLRALGRADQVGSAEHVAKMGELRFKGIIGKLGISTDLTESDVLAERNKLINTDGTVKDFENSLPRVKNLQRTELALDLPITTARQEGIIFKNNVLRQFLPSEARRHFRVLLGREDPKAGKDRGDSIIFLDAHGYDFEDPGGGVTRKGLEDFGPIFPGPGANQNEFRVGPGLNNDSQVLGLILEEVGLVGDLEDADNITIDSIKSFEGDSAGQLERDQRNPIPVGSLSGASARQALGLGGTGGPQGQLIPQSQRTGAGAEAIQFIRGTRQASRERNAKLIRRAGQGVRTGGKSIQDFLRDAIEELRQPSK